MDVRGTTSLLLKNNLRIANGSMTPINQQYMRTELLPCLEVADRHIMSTIGTIVNAILQLPGVVG